MYGTTAPAGRHLFEAACAVLAPDAPQRLVEIFIRQTQPALPILDLQSFPSADPARAAQAGASYGLLTSLLAHSTSYVHEIRPAHKHLWRQVLLSLEDEYRKPTLQTLQQALIVITSRPAINLAQNHIAMGRLASAAQLLGLHLDPSLWRIPHGERVLRKRLWWAVLITDHWRALWYGRPSNISRDSYNVPVPSLADLDAPPDSLSAQSFIAMCKLTTIVNTVLSEFFTVRALAAPRSSTARLEMLDKIGYELAVLEQQLPPGLRRLPSSGDRQAGPVPTGVRSFQLCKLGLEMVMFRLATGSLPEPSAEQLVSTARTALGLAQTLVEFLENLDPEDFTVFWAPYCSFIISSAAALLIRTALTASTLDPATRTAAGVFFTRLVVTLTSSHHVAQWDVASLALDRIATLLRSLDGELPELVPLLQLFGPPNHASNGASRSLPPFNVSQSLLTPAYRPGPPAPPPAQPAPTAAAPLLPHGSTAPLAGPLLTPTGPAPVEQPSPALDAWWWMQTEVLSLPDHLGAPLPDVFEGWPAFAEQGGPGVRTGGAGDGMLFDLRSFLEGPGGDGPGTTAEATGVGAGDDERGGQA
ncbi:co-activator of area [Rhodotorula diobovata]|uniref:Co-activator of area n=1 Tax=Rhodotorula diobovata TaxID=5288 RepID=A0A5C5FS27_9BASI|nr:co-activator of area [Rhodotorula diobovata]